MLEAVYSMYQISKYTRCAFEKNEIKKLSIA